MRGHLNSQQYVPFSSERKRHLFPDMLSEKLFLFFLICHSKLSLLSVAIYSAHHSYLQPCCQPVQYSDASNTFLYTSNTTSGKVTSSFCFKSQLSHCKKFHCAHPSFCSSFLIKIGTSDILLDQWSFIFELHLELKCSIQADLPCISTELFGGTNGTGSKLNGER